MAEDIALFAIKTVGLSHVNGRKPCTLLEAARHNLREIQAELGAVGHIDAQRMGGNVIMAGPSTAAQVQAQADALLASVDTSRLKRDHVQAIEAVFSLPAGSLDVDAYFAGCLEWLRVALPLPILSGVAHHDEAAPHAHVLLLPVADGKHIGGALLKLAELKRMRESFFQKVAGPAGLKRDRAKVRGNVKAWAVAAVLRECQSRGLPDGMGPLWPILKAAIERDPTQSMQAIGLDVNALRPPDARPIGLDAKPIGLQTPIGLDAAIETEVVLSGEKMQALSCVGLHPKRHTKFTNESITTMVELWQRVGLRSNWLTLPPPTRLMAARAAQRAALTKTCHRAAPADDGLTRERGGDGCHDLTAWEGL